MKTHAEINPHYPEVNAIAEQLASAKIPDGAKEIFHARNTVYVLPGEQPMCIKAYRVPGFIKSFIYGHLRKPKAARAFRNAFELRELGIDTPEPMCMAACYNGVGLTKSYYVCRFFNSEWHELRGIEKRPDFTKLAAALASFMALLHSKGVLMKDFTPGNVLFHQNTDGSYSFALIDINRMEFDVHDRNRLLGNFRSTLDTEEGMLELARQYAALSGDSTALVEKIMDIYHRKQKAIVRKRLFKKILGLQK